MSSYELVLNCSSHKSHLDLFLKILFLNATKIRCVYCRAEYNYKDKCFLCLDNGNATNAPAATTALKKTHANTLNGYPKMKTTDRGAHYGGCWGGVTPPHLWPKIAKSRSKIYQNCGKSRSHKPVLRCVMSSIPHSF